MVKNCPIFLSSHPSKMARAGGKLACGVVKGKQAKIVSEEEASQGQRTPDCHIGKNKNAFLPRKPFM